MLDNEHLQISQGGDTSQAMARFWDVPGGSCPHADPAEKAVVRLEPWHIRCGMIVTYQTHREGLHSTSSGYCKQPWKLSKSRAITMYFFF